ncbi:MAG: hypothetical protein ACI9F9_002822 [Candidatus Paceibacteria bacterium]|jgi:hypothetical protein
MARSSPQSFEKRQRERNKQAHRAEKLELRLIRTEDKRLAKARDEGDLDEIKRIQAKSAEKYTEE